MENVQETMKLAIEVRERQSHLLTALASASLGFAISQTNEKPLSWILIVLGLAVILWGYSILNGLIFVGKLNDVSLSLGEAFMVNEFKASSMEDKKKANAEFIRVEQDSKKYSSFQKNSFFIGVVVFIVWHIWEMALRR